MHPVYTTGSTSGVNDDTKVHSTTLETTISLLSGEEHEITHHKDYSTLLDRTSSASSTTDTGSAPIQPLMTDVQIKNEAAEIGESKPMVIVPSLQLDKVTTMLSGEETADESPSMSILASTSLNSPSSMTSPFPHTFSFGECMSPRQQSGKTRYLGGYLQQRCCMAGGFLKSWKRRYFRLRDHGVLCFKKREETNPLFEIIFTAHTLVSLDKSHGDSGNGSVASPAAIVTKRLDSGNQSVASPKQPQKAQGSGSLLFNLMHIEIVGHQLPASKVELPVHFKAENEDDYSDWIECLRFKIEVRKRALVHASVSTLEIAESQNDEKSVSDSSAESPIERPASRTCSDQMPQITSSSDSKYLTSVNEQPSSASPLPSSSQIQNQQINTTVSTETVSTTSISNSRRMFRPPSKSQGLVLGCPTDPPEFTNFRDKYLLLKEIGEGSFSIVHKAVNRLTGRLCAVKCCKYSPSLEEEVGIMRKLSHPNVIGIEGIYKQDDMYYVVMDYMNNGDLCDLLIKRQRLSEEEAKNIVSQVLQGVAYLHRHNILHRDLKPENILLHGDVVKIADFGLAKQLPYASAMLKRSCGTLEYAAPELLCSKPYGLKSDIFSLGVVLYVLLFGAFPFSIESAAALQCMERFPEGMDVRDMSCLSPDNVQWRLVSRQAQDLIMKMLEPNEKKRISAGELLTHPWFDNDTTMSEVENWTKREKQAGDHERSRIADCEEEGFIELLGRGLEVIKYGNKGSTTPHATTLIIDFPNRCIVWTARSSVIKLGSSRKVGGDWKHANNKRGRVIPFDDIVEIRVGCTTHAFQHASKGRDELSPDVCFSIVCAWRTLDIETKLATQRDFLVKGLLHLVSPSKNQEK